MFLKVFALGGKVPIIRDIFFLCQFLHVKGVHLKPSKDLPFVHIFTCKVVSFILFFFLPGKYPPIEVLFKYVRSPPACYNLCIMCLAPSIYYLWSIILLHILVTESSILHLNVCIFRYFLSVCLYIFFDTWFIEYSRMPASMPHLTWCGGVWFCHAMFGRQNYWTRQVAFYFDWSNFSGRRYWIIQWWIMAIAFLLLLF